MEDQSTYDWILERVAIHFQVTVQDLQESLDQKSVEHLTDFVFDLTINMLFVYKEQTLGMPSFSFSDKEEPDKMDHPGIFIVNAGYPGTYIAHLEPGQDNPVVFGEFWKREGRVIVSPISEKLFQTCEDTLDKIEEQRVTIGSEHKTIEPKTRRLKDSRVRDLEFEEKLESLGSLWKKLRYLKKRIGESLRSENTLAREYESLYDLVRAEQKRVLPIERELEPLLHEAKQSIITWISESERDRLHEGSAPAVVWSLLDMLQIVRHASLAPATIDTITAFEQETKFVSPSREQSAQILQINELALDDELLLLQTEGLYSANEETLELLEPYLNLAMPDGRLALDFFVREANESEWRCLERLCRWFRGFYAYTSQCQPLSQSKRFIAGIGSKLKENCLIWEAARKETSRLESTYFALKNTISGGPKKPSKFRALPLEASAESSGPPSSFKQLSGFFQFLWEVRDLKVSSDNSQFDQILKEIPERAGFYDIFEGRYVFTEMEEYFEKLKQIFTRLEQLTQPCIKRKHLVELKIINPRYGDLACRVYEIMSDEFSSKYRSVIYRAKIEEEAEQTFKEIILPYFESARLEIESMNSRSGKALQVLGSSSEVILAQLLEYSKSIEVCSGITEEQEKLENVSKAVETLRAWLDAQREIKRMHPILSDDSQTDNEVRQIYEDAVSEWTKLMEKAAENPNVAHCCTREGLSVDLQGLITGLAACSKGFEAIIQRKREAFPRFYFLSDLAVSRILSAPMDQIEDELSQLFEGVSSLSYDEEGALVGFRNCLGEATETVEFTSSIKIEGNSVNQLKLLEEGIRETMRELCARAASDVHNLSTSEFLRAFPSQVGILGLQILCTARMAEKQSSTSKYWITQAIEDLAQELRESRAKLERIKAQNAIALLSHQRDKQDAKVSSLEPKSPELQGIQVGWNAKEQHAIITLAGKEFIYGLEYHGINERLCLMPLTERSFIAISSALQSSLGASLVGPPGSDKQELLQDLSRTLGTRLVMLDCHQNLSYKQIAQFLKGICSTGFWGCLQGTEDLAPSVLESLTVLSETLSMAKKASVSNLTFPNENYSNSLKSEVALFTIDTSQAHLPAHLKALLRPVSIVPPDIESIITLRLSGNTCCSSTKLAQVLKGCSDRLPGLGSSYFSTKRVFLVLSKAEAEADSLVDESTIVRALQDEINPCLDPAGKQVFKEILDSSFEGKTCSQAQVESEELDITKVMLSINLTPCPEIAAKVKELHAISRSYEKIILAGPAASGKTAIFNSYKQALSLKGKNPQVKRVSSAYSASMGHLPLHLQEKEGESQWIVIDGPIYSQILESASSASSFQTCASSPKTIRTLFEVESVADASPGMVSRCGIVLLNRETLPFQALIEAWIKKRASRSLNVWEAQRTRDFSEKYIATSGLFTQDFFVDSSEATTSFILHHLHLLSRVLELFEDKGEDLSRLDYERIWVFSLAWTIGGKIDQASKMKVHRFFQRLNAPLPDISPKVGNPADETLFDYHLDTETIKWKRWYVPEQLWGREEGNDFTKIVSPTLDMTRAEFFIQMMASSSEGGEHEGGQGVLLIGPPGSSKTTTILLSQESWSRNKIQFDRLTFSGGTTFTGLMESLNCFFARTLSGRLAPIGGRQLKLFIDDLSMPTRSGHPQSLEVIRQLLDSNGFNSLSSQEAGELTPVVRLQLLAAMTLQGKTNPLSSRLHRHFFSIYMEEPSQQTLKRIFKKVFKDAMQYGHSFDNFSEISGKILESTLAILKRLRAEFLPSPFHTEKFQPQKAISKVLKGMSLFGLNENPRTIEDLIKSRAKRNVFLIALWRHEMERTFADSLDCFALRQRFRDILNETCISTLGGLELEEVTPDQEFGDFVRETTRDLKGKIIHRAPPFYKAQTLDQFKEQIADKLQAYNEANPHSPLVLTLFDEAIRLILKISRALSMRGRGLLLVGGNGCGKSSLTRLALFIQDIELVQHPCSWKSTQSDFRDMIKATLMRATQDQVKCSLVLSCFDELPEARLEDLNTLITTGDLPYVFSSPQERETVIRQLEEVIKKERPYWSLSNERDEMAYLTSYSQKQIKRNLSFVFMLPPQSNKLGELFDKFPSMMSKFEGVWMLPWSQEAFHSIAAREGIVAAVPGLAEHMSACHQLAGIQSQAQNTPEAAQIMGCSLTSFIELRNSFKSIARRKEAEINEKLAQIKKALEVLRQAEEITSSPDPTLPENEALNLSSEKKLKDINKELQEKKELIQRLEKQYHEIRTSIDQIKEANQEPFERLSRFINTATEAVYSIKAADINELKGMRNAVPSTRVMLDVIQILFQRPLSTVESKLQNILKQDNPFISDSFDEHTKFTLTDTSLLKKLRSFTELKEEINEETLELIEPYLNFHAVDGRLIFNKLTMEKASSALGCMVVFARAICDYHKLGKEVFPKQKELEAKEKKIQDLEEALVKAKKELPGIEERQAILEVTLATDPESRAKIQKIKGLLRSLQETKAKWIKASNRLEEQKVTLIGDTARASAFLAYCGPLSSEERAKLQAGVSRDLSSRGIPFSRDLYLTSFLVPQSSVQAWKKDPLLSDANKLESMTILQCSKTCPLIIDPEGQAFRWLKTQLPNPGDDFTRISGPLLSKKIELGEPALVEWRSNPAQLDLVKPLINPQFIIRDGNQSIHFDGKEVQVHPAFKLYLIQSGRSVPIELVGSVNAIKFSVSQQALKQELVHRMLRREASSQVDQEATLAAEMASSLKTQEELETEILQGLGNSITKIIADDSQLTTLISSSRQLESLLSKVKDAEANLHKARTELEKAAALVQDEAEKTTVFYSSLAALTGVAKAHPVSIERFLSPIGVTPTMNSEGWFALYKAIVMGFSGEDQATLQIIWAFKLLYLSGQIKREDFALLRLGAEPCTEGPESPFPWIKNWGGFKTLSEWEFTSASKAIFSDLCEIMKKNPEPWKHLIEEEAEPERAAVHIHEGIIREQGPSMAAFLRLCLVLVARPDRSEAAFSKFLEASLGKQFTADQQDDRISQAFLSSSPNEPILLLPDKEADPTSAFEDALAALERQHFVERATISEELKAFGFQRVRGVALSGKWMFLTSCSNLVELTQSIPANAHPDFRLWIFYPGEEAIPMSLALKVRSVSLAERGSVPRMSILHKLPWEQIL